MKKSFNTTMSKDKSFSLDDKIEQLLQLDRTIKSGTSEMFIDFNLPSVI